MIIVSHNNSCILEVYDENHNKLAFATSKNLTKDILDLAKQYPKELLIWHHQNLKAYLNLNHLDNIFHHKNILATYNPFQNNILDDTFHYIDLSFYIKIPKNVNFPTWIMSDAVGGIYSKVLIELASLIQFNETFAYNLLSLAKTGQQKGLFCYSNPNLILGEIPNQLNTNLKDEIDTFKFIKQNYKWFWIWYLYFCLIIFERKFQFLNCIKTLKYKQLKKVFVINNTNINSKIQIVNKKEIDVIIPTMGRANYLFDVLKDFSKQTLLPKRIIIVEQNVDPNSETELFFLKNQDWPFEIIHKFIHKIGVVNARNLALSFVESEWVFLGDDDNRFDCDLLQKLFSKIIKYGVKSGLTVYLQSHEKQVFNDTTQTIIFGAGNAILKSELLSSIKFDPRFEFNYGEDTDFGMQIRNLGEDVVFFSDVKVNHLKAPIGGYRTKFVQLWDKDKIKPSPSPPIMYLKSKYFTEKQLKGYKLLIFLRKLKSTKPLNVINFIKLYKMQWNRSKFWANRL